jgi:hypothetical protein
MKILVAAGPRTGSHAFCQIQSVDHDLSEISLNIKLNNDLNKMESGQPTTTQTGGKRRRKSTKKSIQRKNINLLMIHGSENNNMKSINKHHLR